MSHLVLRSYQYGLLSRQVVASRRPQAAVGDEEQEGGSEDEQQTSTNGTGAVIPEVVEGAGVAVKPVAQVRRALPFTLSYYFCLGLMHDSELCRA
jgi:hypothetical protein